MKSQTAQSESGIRQRHGICVILALSALASSCMVGPKYQRPSAPVPTSYKEPQSQGFKDGEWKTAEPNDAAIRGKWWEMYNNTELNALEEQVNVSNQNIMVLEAQFRQARELVRASRASLFPTLALGGSITNSQNSGTLYGNSLNSLVQRRTIYSAPLSFSYQADVWGSIRRTINANVDSAQITAAQLENARLSYQASLAQTYFQLRGLDATQEILDRTVKSYEDYLQLTRDRLDAGIATDADVAQAETQLNTTQAQLVDLGVARAQYQHAIATLVGKNAKDIDLAMKALRETPPAIPVVVPSTLLERRPDIAAAERQMAAANEQIGIAKAAFYPTIGITAQAGVQTSTFTRWLEWPSKFWSVGPTASEQIFDGGRRKANLRQSQDVFDAAVATYRQTVLTAFQQVEDNLAALRILSDESAAQARAVQSSLRAVDVSSEQYRAGTVDYLQVITTQNAALANQLTAATLLTRRMTSSVLLIQSLGGGWDSNRLPSRDSVIHGQ